MQVDVSLLMKQTAAKLVKNLKDLMKASVDIDGKPYDPLVEPVRAYFYELGQKIKRLSNKRLQRRHKFDQNFVIGTSDDTSLTISANPNSYDGAQTYADILGYNLKGGPNENTRARNGKIFPLTDADVMKLEAAQEFEKALVETVSGQLDMELKDLNQTYHIVIG